MYKVNLQIFGFLSHIDAKVRKMLERKEREIIHAIHLNVHGLMEVLMGVENQKKLVLYVEIYEILLFFSLFCFFSFFCHLLSDSIVEFQVQ